MRPLKLLVIALTFSLLSLVQSVVQAAPRAPEGFADLVDKVMPAVVNISSTQKVREDRNILPPLKLPDSAPDELMDEFQDLYEQFGDNLAQRPEYSLGSGFVIDPAGFIVTNNHVIGDAEEITIIFYDDTQLPAQVVGRDEKTDLALLKVKGDKPFPYVNFGDSDRARVGDWVLAIGNPFGLGGSVSAGIISARARDINAGPFDDFLQTDAAINRGNSGGPMFNAVGQVIGISTAIYSPSGGSVGIGFALPSSQAQPIIKQLREYGQTRRGWLGVKIQMVTPEMAEGIGFKTPKGAAVLEVTRNSPAEKAGILPSDIILEFDGKEIAQMRKLPRTVAETPIGKKVKVAVWRQGKQVTLQVVLGRLEETVQAEADLGETEMEEKIEGAEPLLGMEVTTLTPALREHFDISNTVSGVFIAKVSSESKAAKLGLRKGDVIVTANQRRVSSLAELRTIVQDAQKSHRASILVLINRDGETRFIALPVK